MDGELKKEQIDTLFVRIGLLQGGFWGGWVVQRGSHPFFEGCSIFFFALLSECKFISHIADIFALFSKRTVIVSSLPLFESHQDLKCVCLC